MRAVLVGLLVDLVSFAKFSGGIVCRRRHRKKSLLICSPLRYIRHGCKLCK